MGKGSGRLCAGETGQIDGRGGRTRAAVVAGGWAPRSCRPPLASGRDFRHRAEADVIRWHRRRLAVLLAPFGAGTAHIVQLGAIRVREIPGEGPPDRDDRPADVWRHRTGLWHNALRRLMGT